MSNSKIEWCDVVWNPVAGCSRVSSGCDNCYAVGFARRHAKNPAGTLMRDYAGLTEMTKHGLDWTGKARLLKDRLNLPQEWKKKKRVFVNSMSDLFHESLSFFDIRKLFYSH